MLARAALMVAAVTGSPAVAQTVSERPDSIAVTIYRDNLALIRETRTISLAPGSTRIELRGVADGIISSSAVLEGLPAKLAERNRDFNLLSPGSLLAHSIGKRATLVRTDLATGHVTRVPAVIRSGPAGVMLEVEGRAEALRCSGGPERLVLDEVPAGLSDKPTLSVKVKDARAGPAKVVLTYLARGLGWRADYVADIDPGGETLKLTGWITLTNSGASSFAKAPTSVVAGDLAQRGEADAVARVLALTPRCWPVDSTSTYPEVYAPEWPDDIYPVAAPPSPPLPPPMMAASAPAMRAQLEDLGDYKAYRLPEPTTVAARSQKQVQFLSEPVVAFERVYRHDVSLWSNGASHPAFSPLTVYKLRNDAARGLGKPLPKGTATFIETSDGTPIVAGLMRVEDTAVGAKTELVAGRTHSIRVIPTVLSRTKFKREARDYERIEVAVTIVNGQAREAVVEIREPGLGLDGRVAEETVPHVRVDGLPVWQIKARPNGTHALQYSVERPAR